MELVSRIEQPYLQIDTGMQNASTAHSMSLPTPLRSNLFVYCHVTQNIFLLWSSLLSWARIVFEYILPVLAFEAEQFGKLAFFSIFENCYGNFE